MCGGRAEKGPGLDAFEALGSELPKYVGPLIRDLGQGYALHVSNTGCGDTLLLHAGDPVGYYIGDLIAIHPSHQRKKLSVPLILRSVSVREPPSKRELTEGGRAALTLAWKVANGQAMDPWAEQIF